MSLKTGNELPNEKDVPNPIIKLQIRNDYDEINVFDKVPLITENQ